MLFENLIKYHVSYENRKRNFPKAPRSLYCKKSKILSYVKCSFTSYEKGSLDKRFYNALNRRKNGQSILCGTHLRPPSPWITSINEKLKRLVNHRKGVSQPKLCYKFHKNQRTTSIKGTSTFNLGGLTILK